MANNCVMIRNLEQQRRHPLVLRRKRNETKESRCSVVQITAGNFESSRFGHLTLAAQAKIILSSGSGRQPRVWSRSSALR